jgi:CheY-like chemotaxis protein
MMKKRILVCDDEEPIRLLLNESLQDSYEVVEASNGRDALRLATKEHFDMIIMDIKMPSVHGLEAIERIRTRNDSIPIIICSAYRPMEDDIVVKTSNIAAFMTKPIDIKALKTRIFELIGT